MSHKKWSCSKCTFAENKLDFPTCAVCGSVEGTSKWNCHVCSFLNDCDQEMCEMCGATSQKPTETEKHSMLVAEDVACHAHTLYLTNKDDGWACDGRNIINGCAQGCTDFNETFGWIRYRCQKCDFDLCAGCVRTFSDSFQDDSEESELEESEESDDHVSPNHFPGMVEIPHLVLGVVSDDEGSTGMLSPQYSPNVQHYYEYFSHPQTRTSDPDDHYTCQSCCKKFKFMDGVYRCNFCHQTYCVKCFQENPVVECPNENSGYSFDPSDEKCTDKPIEAAGVSPPDSRLQNKDDVKPICPPEPPVSKESPKVNPPSNRQNGEQQLEQLSARSKAKLQYKLQFQTELQSQSKLQIHSESPSESKHPLQPKPCTSSNPQHLDSDPGMRKGRHIQTTNPKLQFKTEIAFQSSNQLRAGQPSGHSLPPPKKGAASQPKVHNPKKNTVRFLRGELKNEIHQKQLLQRQNHDLREKLKSMEKELKFWRTKFSEMAVKKSLVQ